MRAVRMIVVAALLTAACSGTGAKRGSTPATTASTATSVKPAGAPALLALHATRGSQPAIIDAAGRQVILRGVNLNSLGDYYQADPALPPVVPVTDDDWTSMASHGADVVRLLVSWSALEPRRGVFDAAYLQRIHAAVDAAASHGIYAVIDMHQDAWGKYIASPPGTTCPAGREAAIGWDGAPEWATITDGASTCRKGSRENAEAVLTAWDSFYTNRDGIMDELVATWARLSAEFTSNPTVAGYDLLNEPNHGHDNDRAKAVLATFFRKSIDAIRAAEQGHSALHHIVFFETTVAGLAVAPDFTADSNIVFAPHNYAESLIGLRLEVLFDVWATEARGYRTAMWTGEYGWFGTPTTNAAKLARFAAKSDALLTAGDAWWQWRQACGDPHTIGHPGGSPEAELIHFQSNGCPGDHNGGVVPQWQCEWRPFPRAAPGLLHQLTSDCTSRIDLSGSTDQPGTVDVWFPDHGVGHPVITGQNVTDAHTAVVPGGWRVTARVSGAYTVSAVAQL